ncbi:claspin isoform X1 [Dendroctonus ponderosae]|uniref:claspin isoform X1 n=1 Tax=Dendroctonus ponderosae TaxID=77166 RepID=UPI002035733F|nr:claspin isoform X1 [Dendroctonus ponderosae]KAH1014426.1 hypothetical protein HUJ05_012294 [Dendroctonus ponderosae]
MDLPNSLRSMDEPSVGLGIQENNGSIPSSPMAPQNIEPCVPDGLSGPEGSLGISIESKRSEITEKNRVEANKLAPLEHVLDKPISGPLLDDTGSDRAKSINSEKVNSTSRVRRKIRRITILESDSELEELSRTQEVEEYTRSVQDYDGSEFRCSDAKGNRPGANEDDSDSDNKEKEEEVSADHCKEVNCTSKRKRKSRIIGRVDSDNDSNSEEQMATEPPEVMADNLLTEDDDAASVFSTNSSNGEIVSETKGKQHNSALALLCDSESHDEQMPSKQDYSLSEKEPTQQTSGKSAKIRLQRQFEKDRENFPKKVTTVKDAAEQRKQIQSESQRMLRERTISLPYHKPKTRSLKEFLSRRPKLSRALPEQAKRTAPSIAIKMTNDQLELISIKLKEREKEVKEFYRSESESDNEESESVEGNHIATDNEQKPASNEATANNSESAIQEDPVQVQNRNGADLQTSNNEVEPETSTEPISHTEAQLETEEQPNELSLNEPMNQQDQSNATISESNSIQAQKRASETYDFTLDSSIEDPNTSTEVELGKPDSSGSEKAPTFSFTEIDREIENFAHSGETVDSKELAPPCPAKSALELLKEKLANDTPKLSGEHDDLIDLNSVTKPNQFVELMERFAKHVSSTKKNRNQHKVKLSIVSVERGGDIRKEEVAVNVDSDEEDLVVEEKPGAKLHKLKVDLQNQMQQKKAELWQQKAAKGLRAGALTSEGQENEEDVLDDDEEETEMTDEEETDEDLEDDVDMREKSRKKSDFLDEEADVTDDDEEEEDESVKEGFENNAVEDQEEVVSEPGTSEDIHEPEQRKVLKRILKPTDSDSEEEDLFNDSVAQKSLTNVQLDSTITADEDDIPSHQPPQVETPVKAAVSQGKSITEFLTPISFLTSIQNLASISKSNKKEAFMSPFKMPLDLQNGRSVKQKKLFSDTDILDSQGSLNTQEFSLNVQGPSAEEPPNTQDLLNICSGQFTGITPIESTESTGKVDEFKEAQSGEFKSLGQEDMIISQLLDEEELELFKKKFDSPVNQASTVPENKEVSGGGVIDSDDDGETVGAGLKKRKNQKRIQFSDDDSSEDGLNEDEEKIDLHDNVESDNEQDVAYDSEENEIEISEAGKPQKFKLKDFVEAEAELSESEWGSEDEDEKDMDKLEFELGDTETFDEEQVKSDLEKIHMRRMLDDDTREVKLLQELLLEDGEMHGTGRQRQFKWKNIDLADERVENKQDDDIFFDEEESEEQWRKKRHEREMFLKQQQQRNLDVDFLGNGQLLQIGQKILQKSQNSQNTAPVEKTKADKSPFKNTPFNIQNKRGSFLNRSDQVLNRVAKFTKVVTEVDIHSKKTTKHFLFQRVSADASSSSTTGKKRKAAEGTPRLLKKLRLNTDLSPAVKKLDKPERSRKLFNF